MPTQYTDLISRYSEELTAFARSQCRDKSHAEDIVHDTYLRYRKAAESVEIKNVRAFLYRIARNLIIDHARSSIRRQEKQAVLQSHFQNLQGDYEERESLIQQRQALLKELVAELPQKCREVFILHKLKRLKHEEIAERLGISKSTVEKHVIKGLRHCRAGLKKNN